MTDKPHLILLPGQLCDAALWGPQIAGLADLATIAVADLTLDDRVGAMAERLLRDAPPRFALAGLSLGGYVAFEIMRQAPGRVTHLALMNTSARADDAQQAVRRENSVKAAEIGTFKGVTSRFLPTILHPDHLADPVLAKLVLDMTERVGRRAFATQQAAAIHRPDSRPNLAGIACPTLVIGGRADRVTPRELQHEIAAGIPGAKLEILENCGHLSPIERPNTVNRLLRALLR